MDLDILYEVTEYGKVLLGYVFLMAVAPSVIFYKHLHPKSVAYRFGFCITIVPVSLNGLVLFLGLFHILDIRLVRYILTGIFCVSVLRFIWDLIHKHPSIRCIVHFHKNDPIHRQPLCRHIVHVHKNEWMHAVLWTVTLLFGLIYFSYSAFQIPCYGCGDLYVHHSWIYGLMQGTVYAGGIYPEAMHCFIYCMKALWGISVFSCLRYIQCIHVTVFLLAACLMLREIFHWRYTPLFTILLFLMLDVRGADMISSISRLQWTLPMEFGLPCVFICVWSFMRYIKSNAEGKEGFTFFGKEENLPLFFLSLTATLSTHYYTTIMAFFLCIPMTLCAWRKVFRWKCLLPCMVAAMCSLLVALAPMAWALTRGIPFEPSINWALRSMSGEEAREQQELLEDIDETSEEKGGGVYRYGYAKVYGEGRGILFLSITVISFLFCLTGKYWKTGWTEDMGERYVPLLLMSVLFMITYAAPYIGLPQVISDGRFCSIGHLCTLAAVLILPDIACHAFVMHYGELPLQKLSVLAAAGMYVILRLSGMYHGYLYYELSRYPEAVILTRSIMENYMPHSYIIISPTDELYQVIEEGGHEELLSFVRKAEEEEYRLRTEHIFFYVEKKPLLYAQRYFMEGPAWIGEEKYPDICREEYKARYPLCGVSQAPEIAASEISFQKAEMDLRKSDDWGQYTWLENREILESKAYKQCMRLMQAYPNQMEIYYENDHFICFHLEQKGAFPYNLALSME